MKQERVAITTDYIKLDQLLKFSGIAESGAVAKDMILDGIVLVNGTPCTMRGKKMRPGDCAEIQFEDETLQVLVENS
jgi:ribosome-associated protein